ncbi:MAG: PAS domain S-box protein [Smithellaceae bacterium]|jgi:diguanylate cyclase (GGDEF)-like protein/PAS domain S-box-containing protein|nr:PAS domain S-box protein [Smithellaceae bacterium]MDD3258993.1 PAS domain S-box protein [Smithellaceae bacterium]MDD3848961.1 PAS domain S-box protein [Smithellaceae bacterium]HOG11366.1 PAS domain S-box protein [Smithellaceae bacterium]HPL09410.1 PAS domain S-box protein [Smithellaceae bacterium]
MADSSNRNRSSKTVPEKKTANSKTSKARSKPVLSPGGARVSPSNDIYHLSKDILSNVGVAIYIVQRGWFVYVSSLYQTMTGYSEKELLHHHCLEFIHPEDREKTRENAIAALKRERTDPYEYRFIKKNGDVMWILERVASIPYEGTRAALGSFMDITERRRMEMIIRQSEEKYRSILEGIEDGYAELDLKGNLVFFNEALCRIQGYPREELARENYRRLMDEENAAKMFASYHRVFTTGQSEKDVQYEVIAKDGARKSIESSITPVKNDAGRIVAFRGILRDRTGLKQAEEALRRSEERYRTILEESDNAYFEVDLAGNYTFVNDALSRLLGYSKEELIGRTFRDQVNKEDTHLLYRAFGKIYTTGEPERGMVYKSTRKGGETRYSEVSGFPLHNAKGEIVGFRGIGRDITLQRLLEEALRQSEERYRTILEEMDDAYFEVDLAGNYTFVNDAISRLLGYPKEKLLGRTFRDQVDKKDTKILYNAFGKIYTTGKPQRGIFYKYARKDGSARYAEISGFPLHNSKGEIVGFRGIGRDITERKKSEERIQYLATHDGLTGLPNRILFNQLLQRALQSAKRYQRMFAMFFIDLDRFKMINDTLGHDAGDQLLREIAVRFKQKLRAVDTVARLGGDEFVILIEELEDLSYVTTVARRILSAALQPMTIMGEECRVTASIGVSLFPKDGEDEQTLMKNADVAMYFAKEDGKNNFKFYSHDIQSQSARRLSIETRLRFALEKNEFFLQYQARLDIRTGKITGVEALLRWDNPDLGLLMPARFIPVAEDTGMIVPIGRWVLRTACFQNAAWQKMGLPPVCMSVNLSMRQLNDVHLIVDVERVLRESGLAPHLLELEITEHMIMHNPARIIAVLNNIRKLGVRIAIDDFGTGYSSLAQIRHFPVDALKIDRSFMRNIMENPEDIAVARAILSMGKTLSLTVVAEGVETEEQMAFLQKHACDEMQGFHFSAPVSPEQFADLLRNHLPSSIKSCKE